MAIQFATISTPGGFFKPADHMAAAAILIEPKKFERQKPTNFGPKDTIHADLTIFASDDNAKAGKGEEVLGTQIQQTILVRDLEALVGQATVAKLVQRPSDKPGQNPAWVWRPVEPDIQAAVVAYAEQREASADAALAAAGEMPDFLS